MIDVRYFIETKDVVSEEVFFMWVFFVAERFGV